jgi:hypothetical protein
MAQQGFPTDELFADLGQELLVAITLGIRGAVHQRQTQRQHRVRVHAWSPPDRSATSSATSISRIADPVQPRSRASRIQCNLDLAHRGIVGPPFWRLNFAANRGVPIDRNRHGMRIHRSAAQGITQATRVVGQRAAQGWDLEPTESKPSIAVRLVLLDLYLMKDPWAGRIRAGLDQLRLWPNGGQAVERWGMADNLAIMQQLGMMG